MEADYLVLADSAQVVGDKLYLLGGGWSFVHAPQYPVNHRMTVVAGLLVDWMETNRRHNFLIELREEDQEHRVLVKIEGAFEQGRPPGLPAGCKQRVQLAMGIDAPLSHPGEYEVRMLINGQAVKVTQFTAMAAPGGLPIPPSLDQPH